MRAVFGLMILGVLVVSGVIAGGLALYLMGFIGQ